MNSEKVGKFIKKLRKDNNLTQKDLAEKYGITYQAVSKWENGINLPDTSLIRQMSKDFNISVDDILDGEPLLKNKNKRRNVLVISVILIIIILFVVGTVVIVKRVSSDKTFSFKTLSTACKEFNVSGSIAYDKNKSSIYISHINYCGGNDTSVYKKIECNLYESEGDTSTLISSCKSNNKNVMLEEYLKSVELNIDNYQKTCKKYSDNSLYLEINAILQNSKVVTYKIPLKLKSNCSR